MGKQYHCIPTICDDEFCAYKVLFKCYTVAIVLFYCSFLLIDPLIHQYTHKFIHTCAYNHLFSSSHKPWHINNPSFLVFFFNFTFIAFSSTFLKVFLSYLPSAAFHFYESVGTAAGCLLITLSTSPAPQAVSSPWGSAPLLMETNSSYTRGRGVSKHPLSSYK